LRRTLGRFSLPARKGRFDPFRRAFFFLLLLAAVAVAVLLVLDDRAVTRQEEVLNDQQFLSATLARLAAEDRFASVDAASAFLLNYVFSRTLDGTMTPSEAQNYLQPMVYNMPEVLGFYFLPNVPGKDFPPVTAFRSTPAGNDGRVFAASAADRLGPGLFSQDDAVALSGSVMVTPQQRMALFCHGFSGGGSLRGVLLTVVDLSAVLSRYVVPTARGRSGFSMVLSGDGTPVWFNDPSQRGPEGSFGRESPELESVRSLVSGAVSGKSSLEIPGGNGGSRLLVAWNTLRMGGKRLAVVLASPAEEAEAALSGLRTQRNLLLGPLLLLVVLGSAFFTGKQRQEEIKRREAGFRAVFDNASSGIAILSVEGRFLSCNATWETMTGLSQERLRQKTIFDLAAPGQGRDELGRILGGNGGSRRSEARFSRADGVSFWGDVTLTPMDADPSLPPGALLALITDISGMKRAEDLLKQNAATLEAQKAELEKLASDQGMLLDLFALFAEAESPGEIHRALFASLPVIITFRNLFLCVREPGKDGRYTTLDAMNEVERSGQAGFGSEGKGIVGYVLRTGKAYIAGDLAMDPYYVSHSEEARSLVAVPISYKGKDWGVLCLDSAVRYAFGVRERDLLGLVGFYVALHLEEVEARAELGKKAKQLGFLHRVIQHFAAERTNEDLSRRIVDILGAELGFPLVGILAPGGEDGENMTLLAGHPGDTGGDDMMSRFASRARDALRTGLPVAGGENERPGTLAVPLSFNGTVFAVLAAWNERGFTPSEKELLEITAEHGATFWVLNNLLAERRHEALIDPLTQVWNRRYIMRRLEEENSRISRNGSRGTVVLVDLGDFKRINDRFGHATGDEVLRETASLMSKNLRTCDMIGRYGGDEFLLYLPDVTADQAAAAMLRMEDRVAEMKVPGVNTAVVLDYGMASCPGDGNDLVEAIGVADARMYENKARRKAETA